ncbi:312_t:CDS:2, partial [Cetraspora pellucida]
GDVSADFIDSETSEEEVVSVKRQKELQLNAEKNLWEMLLMKKDASKPKSNFAHNLEQRNNIYENVDWLSNNESKKQ